MTQPLAKLAGRNMQLNCTIQDGQVWLANHEATVQVEVECRLQPAPEHRRGT